MAIYNANEMLRFIRKKSGLSQEKFCKGICSTQALSNIENGKNGVSPVTFELLVARVGVNIKPFPCFASKNDFECFMKLHRAEFYIDSWQFDLAYDELRHVENMQFSNNKYYYQKWVMLNCKIKILTERCSYHEVKEALLQAIRISIPSYKDGFPEDIVIGSVEIDLFIMLAEAYICTEYTTIGTEILDGLERFVDKISISQVDAFLFKANIKYVRGKLLLYSGKTLELECFVYDYYKQATAYNRSIPLFRFAFLYAATMYNTGRKDAAKEKFMELFAALRLVNSDYYYVCMSYIIEYTDLEWDIFEDFKFINERPKDFALVLYDYEGMRDGTFSFQDKDILTYGKLLLLLRRKKNLSITKVCNGLCSKSQYSKIENDLAIPSVMLARGLLQRLGITENLFDFWSNDEEFKYENLSEKIGILSLTDNKRAQELLAEIEGLSISKDKLIQQRVLMGKAIFGENGFEKKDKLLKAMSMTRPGFLENKMTYPLTNTEFDIAQHYIRCNLKLGYDLEITIRNAMELADYYEEQEYDITQSRINIPMLYFIISPYLQKSSQYGEMNKIQKKCEQPLMQYYVAIKASIYMDYLLLHYQYDNSRRMDYLSKLRMAYYSMKLTTVNEQIIKSIDQRLQMADISNFY